MIPIIPIINTMITLKRKHDDQWFREQTEENIKRGKENEETNKNTN